ncbi:MAG: sigma-70 family RNA polymerase sigma factor [Erysipelotrichia bacterium]|nr:sigma-70 family RNA polymerase sigma factor [Candidatus Riflebacteria bacterium]NCB37146.1 sigma-70 family RNA polymerase sigma factor [Erysipelotrichia bacterium]
MKNIGTFSDSPLSKVNEEASDSLLLEEIRRGSQKAFAKFVSRYEKSVYRICYRFFSDENDALDAAQEVFLKVYKYIDKFEGRSSFKTWIYRIASNTCITLAEKKKREKDGLLQNMMRWWSDVTHETPEEEVLERELRLMNQKIVAEKVSSLPEVYRMPVILKDMEGLPLDKISEILEVPIGTVKSRINRGRRLLQESLQAYVYGRI